MYRFVKHGLLVTVSLILLLVAGKVQAAPVPTEGGPTKIFLPVISNGSSMVDAPQVSIPYVNYPPSTINDHIGEFPVFWFGEVRNAENYVDVRVAYNSEEMFFRLHVFDRGCFFDETEPLDEPTRWDGAAILLNHSGNTGSAPSTQSYQFLVQFDPTPTWNPPWETIKFSFQGNGSGWAETNLPFSMTSSNSYMGDPVSNCRGWTAVIRIPFSSMGLSTPPSQGTIWGLSVINYDRDDAEGTYLQSKVWPRTMNPNSPGSWGQLRFGLPSPTQQQTGNVTVIRQGLNNQLVSDASVGGYAVCGNGTDFWSQWGDTNEGFYNPELSDFNIQNQGNVADWHCFSKVYVSFPLDQVPAGKKILSATLKMHIWGAAGPYPKPGSLIHVYTISEPWNEFTLTWNNAPYIERYIDQTWVATITTDPGFPGIPVEWNVTSAVAESYNNGNSVDLVLYSSDNWRHSGKYFSSSNTGDWNAEGRPLLTVVWSD